MDINSEMDQAKGKAEQAVGDATDDQELKDQGERHEAGGKLKAKLNDLKDSATDAVDKVQDKIDEKKNKD